MRPKQRAVSRHGTPAWARGALDRGRRRFDGVARLCMMHGKDEAGPHCWLERGLTARRVATVDGEEQWTGGANRCMKAADSWAASSMGSGGIRTSHGNARCSRRLRARLDR
jgi:hypothetical protein